MSGHSKSTTLNLQGDCVLACPFFMPVGRSEDGVWLHPSRLPLGSGWAGHCTAQGYEGALPDTRQLQEECNLGYAATCPRLPGHRPWDAVRFVVFSEHESRICLAYVCERDHLPAEHGKLEYRIGAQQWANPHFDPRIQRMAQCFLESWFEKSRRPPAANPQRESVHERT